MQHYLIIGAGISGVSAAKLLVKKGASGKIGANATATEGVEVRIRISEHSTLSEERREQLRLLSPAVEVLDGGHQLSHLDGIDVVILSPGLPAKHPLVEEAKKQGLPLVSEVDLALWGGASSHASSSSFSGEVIGVTGTNGKSTTCAMLHHMLSRLGCRASIGGNFGDPPSLLLAEDRAQDVMVLELSSYQLEDSEKITPAAAVFTSFSNDHLARHGSVSNYFAAKWRLFDKNRKSNQTLKGSVMPYWIQEQAASFGFAPAPNPFYIYRDLAQMRSVNMPGAVLKDGVITFSDGESLTLTADVHAPLTKTLLQYDHNQSNLVFAAAAIRSLPAYASTSRVRWQDIFASIDGFSGLRHRCEPIGTIHGQPVLNDSKSTNVESTCAALKNQKKPVILLMGGQGKGESYLAINDCKTVIKSLVCFGASGQKIAEDLVGSFFPVQVFATLNEALTHVTASLLPKDAAPVLFSPGCASFDEFRDYMHRGDEFCAFMQKHLDR